MRILVISLLRLGDLILQKPLIEGLKLKYPQGEIHLLVNQQFSQVEFLFAGLVDHFIYFDREKLQKSCGEKEFNIFWGVQSLKNFIGDVNQIEYDVTYNFTHNRLTAHLSELLKSKKRVGIYSQQGAFFGLTNPWIQFFNNYFGRVEAAGFHYTELLARALEISLPREKAKIRTLLPRKKILIQPLTSDKKKNWDLGKFKSLAEDLTRITSAEVRILGASFEKDVLLKEFSQEQLLICDFEGAAEHLKEARLLITGDTSVKHLAALYEVPILELALGSSQPLQVGAFSNESVILQSRVSCGPCPHSQPCSQATRICEEKLSVSTVSQAAQIILGLDKTSWNQFGLNQPELNIYRTEIRHLMGWTVDCLAGEVKNQIEEILQRKMMIVEELDRRQRALSKGVSNEQRTRKLPDGGAEAP